MMTRFDLLPVGTQFSLNNEMMLKRDKQRAMFGTGPKKGKIRLVNGSQQVEIVCSAKVG